jgi:hypothetical protein
VSQCGLAIYIKKKYLNAKEELQKFKYFTMQKYNLKKNPLKKPQNPSRNQRFLQLRDFVPSHVPNNVPNEVPSSSQ